MVKSRRLTALHSGTPTDGATNAEAVKVVAQTSQALLTSINSLEDYLEEPLKSQFAKVKDQINTMLAKLPATDQVPAAMSSDSVLRQLLGVLSYAQDLMKNMTAAATDLGSKLQSTRASMSGEVEKAINDKVKAGEFVSKANHEAAIANATKVAREAVLAEVKLLGDRRTALASAGIPVPADADLAGDEATFNAKRDEAKTRAESLKPFTVEAQHMTQLCWGPKEAYELSVGVLKTATEAAGKKTETASAGAGARSASGFQTSSGGKVEMPASLMF